MATAWNLHGLVTHHVQQEDQTTYFETQICRNILSLQISKILPAQIIEP